MVLGDSLKKILLAGLGTIAATAEKSKEIIDDLVKKGELTVEQGKILDRDLPKIDKDFPKNLHKSIKEKVAKISDKGEDSIRAFVEGLPDDKLGKLKELIREKEEKAEEVVTETAAAAEEAVAGAAEAVNAVAQEVVQAAEEEAETVETEAAEEATAEPEVSEEESAEE